jgi:hypothetical protein
MSIVRGRGVGLRELDRGNRNARFHSIAQNAASHDQDLRGLTFHAEERASRSKFGRALTLTPIVGSSRVRKL